MTLEELVAPPRNIEIGDVLDVSGRMCIVARIAPGRIGIRTMRWHERIVFWISCVWVRLKGAFK